MSVRKTRGMLDSLIQTTPEVIENIKEFEKKGLFSEHVDPINPDLIMPVGDDFPYIKKPIKLRLKYFFIYNFVVKVFEPRELKRMGYKVVGRENLKGIKRAVVTSNHINKLDCTLNRHALKGHKVYITAADFNNMKGFLGDIMRASRMMPLGSSMAGMKNFDGAVNTLLKKNNYVLFYPERSEWWCYKKPRPMMVGAFHFAVKNNVPVIPNFITFKENGKKDVNGIDLYDMTVNILKPIYPNPELSPKENIKYMMAENERLWKECYEKTYGIKLEYTTIKK